MIQGNERQEPGAKSSAGWARRSAIAAVVTNLTALSLAASSGACPGPAGEPGQDAVAARRRSLAMGESNPLFSMTPRPPSSTRRSSPTPARVASASRRRHNTNIRYWDALAFLDNLKDTANQIKNDPGSVNWGDVQGGFDRLYDFAQQIAGDIIAGKAVKGVISVSPTLAGSYKNVGLLGYGGIAGVALLTPGTGTGPNEDKRTLEASAGFMNITTFAVPYAFKIPYGSMGVSAKYVRANYTGISFLADASTQTLTGRSFQDVNDAKPDLDVGYRTDPGIRSGASKGWTGRAAASGPAGAAL